MKLAVMQPYFFPYIGYFQCIHAVDKYILYDNLNFTKSKWIEKNSILINSSPATIALELVSKSSFKKIKDIKIFELNKWQRKTLKSITLNYGRANFFDEIYPLIESLILYETCLISEFNKNAIIEISKALGLQSEIICNTEKFDLTESKLEEAILDESYFSNYKLEILSRKKLRVFEICKQMKADTYVNAIGGQELYKKDEFKQNGLDLFFVKTLDYQYKQRSEIFHPNLSIIDVLFNCGIEGTKVLVSNYELI